MADRKMLGLSDSSKGLDCHTITTFQTPDSRDTGEPAQVDQISYLDPTILETRFRVSPRNFILQALEGRHDYTIVNAAIMLLAFLVSLFASSPHVLAPFSEVVSSLSLPISKSKQ